MLYMVSFVPCVYRAQSGRRTSFGRRVWFIEPYIVLAICFSLIYLFIYLLIYLFIYLFIYS
jgi:hypothetical protein